MVIALREPRLVNRLERAASERAQPVEQVLEAAVQPGDQSPGYKATPGKPGL